MPIPLKAHASSVFLDKNHFAETITYKHADGRSRSIKAVVSRDPIDATPGQQMRTTNRYIVAIQNDAITGAFLAEIKIDNDRVSLPSRETSRGKTEYIVRRIIDQDEGMITLEVAS
jgi:hypothetical protein